MYCEIVDGLLLILVLPGGMAFAAGTGDPVMQNKNIISPALQMGKGSI